MSNPCVAVAREQRLRWIRDGEEEAAGRKAELQAQGMGITVGRG